jgi:hypothetical protein
MQAARAAFGARRSRLRLGRVQQFGDGVMLPSKDHLTICFAHIAYRLRDRFLALATGIESFEVRDGDELESSRSARPTCW